MKRGLLAAGALAVIGVLVLLWRETRSEAPVSPNRVDSSATSTTTTADATATTRSTPTTTPGEKPVLVDAQEANRRAQRGTGLWGMTNVLDIVPESYELTAASGMVAVNVNGGRSGMSPASPLFPGGARQRVSGKVVDREGTGVAGAAVIVSTKMHMRSDSFLAAGGAMSSADGTFEIADVPMMDEPLVAMAMHPRGWSLPTPIVKGAVVLSVLAGSLEGRVTYNGAGGSFDLRISSSEKKLNLTLESNADGTFKVAILPPGAYTLGYGRVQKSGTAARDELRDFTIEDGKVTRLDLAQAPGAVVTAIAHAPEGVTLTSVEAMLLAGKEVPKDPKSARTRGRAENAPMHLVGGKDATTKIVFQDVPPGDYTICMTNVEQDVFGCRVAEVHERAKSVDVGVDLNRL